MLSARELALVEKIGQCMSEYQAIRRSDADTDATIAALDRTEMAACSADLDEFGRHVNALQRMVMARSAQRAHPERFMRRPVPVPSEEVGYCSSAAGAARCTRLAGHAGHHHDRRRDIGWY